MYKIFVLAVTLFFIGCGYKPTSYFAKEVLGNNIYAQIDISRTDPKNSVIIKDAINEAIITRFGARLSTKEAADTKIYVSLSSVKFTPILYDINGYVISYKAKVTLKMRYIDKADESGIITTEGEYDFPIEANSVISDTKRFEAIRYASLDAINEFVSKVSIKGIQHGKYGQ
jgi:hypothetical protein